MMACEAIAQESCRMANRDPGGDVLQLTRLQDPQQLLDPLHRTSNTRLPILNGRRSGAEL